MRKISLDDGTADEVERLQRLADLLDAAVPIPGTQFAVGLDGILGLIPGIGDSATMIAGLWIVARARKLGVPLDTCLKMLGNLAVDWTIGLIPVAGDLFDIGWKAHRRNLRLIRAALQRQGRL